MLQQAIIFILVCITTAVLSNNSHACSCLPPPVGNKSIEQIRTEKRNYFLNEFEGAAFVGKILKRELVIVNWMAKTETGEPADFSMYRYTIRIKEYWFGVKSRTVIVYAEPAEPLILKNGDSFGWSSCGFKLKTGRTYFFTTSIYVNNLQIDQCDFAQGGSNPKKYPATEFRKIMGEPKRLRNLVMIPRL